jgi:hypothetical protein
VLFYVFTTVKNASKIGWAENVARVEEVRNAYSVLAGKSESKNGFERRRRRWEDNIRMDIREQSGKVWTGCICLRTGTSGGFL